MVFLRLPALIFYHIVLLTGLPVIQAHAYYWIEYMNRCRPPKVGEVIMANPSIAGPAGSLKVKPLNVYSPNTTQAIDLCLTGNVGSLGERLIHVSAGVLSLRAHSTDDVVGCDGSVAAISYKQRASLMWTGPPADTGNVTFTMAFAQNYGPVTIYEVLVSEQIGTTIIEVISQTHCKAARGCGGHHEIP